MTRVDALTLLVILVSVSGLPFNGQTSAKPSGQTSAKPSGQTSAKPSGQTRAEPSGQTRAEPSGQTRAEPSGQTRANNSQSPAKPGATTGQNSLTTAKNSLTTGQNSLTPAQNSLATNQNSLTTAENSLTAAQRSPDLPRILQRLQSKLDESRLTAKFPGAQVGFVLPDGQTPDGQPRFRSASVSTGLAELQTRMPLKTSHRMLAASIGKTFVAAVTLLLVQEGKLNLDDSTERWLGNEKWFAQLPNAKDITLRMLLNHSSGIPNHVDVGNFWKALLKSASRDINYEELVAYVLNKKPLFPAGTGYSYADTNYILLGMIIERATGRSLYKEITERILTPQKLNRIIPSNALILPEVANGYFENKPVIVGGKFTINPQWEWAGGGFAASAEDLARWANALYGGGVLAQSSLDQMMNSTTSGEGASYGLGVMITKSKWGKSYGHDGEFPGYLSEMRYYPRYKIAVAVMVNSGETPDVMRFLGSAADDFAGLIIKETFTRELSQADQIRLQKLAESWLNLIDKGKYGESWEELSMSLKAKFAKANWQSALSPLLAKAGKVKARAFKSISYADPESETVAVDFESSFTKGGFASETIVLVLETGGHWHVASYAIH